MDNIECPRPAYERLVESGLYERIFDKKELINSILLYRDLDVDREGERILEETKKELFDVNKLISPLNKIYEDIFLLKNCIYKEERIINPTEFNDVLIKHPSFLGYLVLGKDLLNFKEYDFPSRKSLEESIASFCIGEESLISDWRRFYCWRNGDFKNQVILNEHGDLYVSQTDISGEICDSQTLFGALQTFETMKRNPEIKAISEYQDWSNFLASVLKYAEAIGKEKIPEIVNWEKTLKEVGAVGTATECMFGGSGMDLTEFLMKRPVLKENENKYEYFPLAIGEIDDISYPFVTNKGDLIYLKESGEGRIFSECKRISSLKNLKLTKELTFNEEDLPHLLRSTYKFFARDKSRLPKIMNWFLNNKE